MPTQAPIDTWNRYDRVNYLPWMYGVLAGILLPSLLFNPNGYRSFLAAVSLACMSLLAVALTRKMTGRPLRNSYASMGRGFLIGAGVSSVYLIYFVFTV